MTANWISRNSVERECSSHDMIGVRGFENRGTLPLQTDPWIKLPNHHVLSVLESNDLAACPSQDSTPRGQWLSWTGLPNISTIIQQQD